ncbi:hypothetical protein GLYMA_15G119125v4 [Glycine max]|nr:hypothetical protein GLYMA_15G119125v4 [Glycine max]KAH1146741.1 hypothetical protein GYH30_042096 [Glycine max]
MTPSSYSLVLLHIMVFVCVHLKLRTPLFELATYARAYVPMDTILPINVHT